MKKRLRKKMWKQIKLNLPELYEKIVEFIGIEKMKILRENRKIILKKRSLKITIW